MCMYMHMYMYIYIRKQSCSWVFITGGCSGRGVQWIGVVLYSKLVCNIV